MAESSINMGSYRTLFPFFLIIAVVLLLIWRLIVSPGLSATTRKCPEGTSSYWAQPGDSCWEISRKNGWSLDKFEEVNPTVVCDPLMPGTSVCLPPLKKQTRRRVWTWYIDTRMYDSDIGLFIKIYVSQLAEHRHWYCWLIFDIDILVFFTGFSTPYLYTLIWFHVYISIHRQVKPTDSKYKNLAAKPFAEDATFSSRFNEKNSMQ